jgi:hypothetical protein
MANVLDLQLSVAISGVTAKSGWHMASPSPALSQRPATEQRAGPIIDGAFVKVD